MRHLLFLVCIVLIGCDTRIDNLLTPGAPVGAVEAVFGVPDLITPNRMFWCNETEHGVKQLIHAKVVQGELASYPVTMYEYSGDCQELLNWWADRLDYAESIGMEERF